MAIAFEQTIPILRIFDVAKARAFYVDYLGFTACGRASRTTSSA
jgi:ribosomal-protein-alanine N-acetyltransferase